MLPNGVATPADTVLLGEIISTVNAPATNHNGEALDAFLLPPPSPRHDGVALTEPTQWEQFADSIVKTHLDKTLRRGGASAGNGGENEAHVTEQNIEL